MHFLPIEEKILQKIYNDSMTEIEKVKLRFGFYIFLDTLKKSVIIYCLACFLQIFVEVAIVHISFLLIRQVSFGWHGRSSIECIIHSVVFFVAVPYFLSTFDVLNTMIVILGVLIALGLVIIIGPTGTKKNNLEKAEIISLQRKLLIRGGLVLFIFVLIPGDYQQFVFWGVIIQLLLLVAQFTLNNRKSTTKV